MARLAIFVGIGLVLVGVFGYLLAVERSVMSLLPTLGGVFMAIAGMICLTNYRYRESMMQFSCTVAVFLFLASSWLTPFVVVGSASDIVPTITVLDVAVLSGIFLFFAINTFLEQKQSEKYAKMAADGQKMKDGLTKV